MPVGAVVCPRNYVDAVVFAASVNIEHLIAARATLDNVHPFGNFVITISVIVGVFGNAYVTDRNGSYAFSFNRLGSEFK